MTTQQAPKRIRRCALYTRKSSDEGLDQTFNSLDAQREACAAYVKSQRHEGWRALPEVYDDGGFSDGSMERPALKRLLADIASGLVDVVVVYKIDRLTRSLADFARIVELFERHQVSIVSVTQSFNTTSSMGRLTLNVLLSFAQFEREVTGERIRDKIAASKAKGMWMGGTLPLGYDRPTEGTARVLRVNEVEAAIVQMIFSSYLELGSVHALERHLQTHGVRSKLQVSAKGASRGGVPFSRGALFHLLRNPIYLGKITHRDKIHPGLHAPIIGCDLFEAVQARLTAQTRRSDTREGRVAHASLTGRLFDADGQPMSPTFAYGRKGKLYRYYVSAPLQQGGKVCPADPHPRRVSASVLEGHLTQMLQRLQVANRASTGLTMPNAPAVQTALTAPTGLTEPSARANLLHLIHRVDLHADTIVLILSPDARRTLALNPSDDLRLRLPFRISTQRGRTDIVTGDRTSTRRDPVLIRALRHGHAMLAKDHTGMPILDNAPDTPRQRRLVRLAFLAPDIQRDILAGQQPQNLTLAALLDGEMPVLWSEQRALLARFGQDGDPMMPAFCVRTSSTC